MHRFRGRPSLASPIDKRGLKAAFRLQPLRRWPLDREPVIGRGRSRLRLEEVILSGLADFIGITNRLLYCAVPYLIIKTYAVDRFQMT